MLEKIPDEAQIVAVFISAIIAVIAGFTFAIRTATYNSDENECGYASVNAGVTTKFVRNSYWSWECYVMLDGKYVPIDKWRGVDNA